MIQSIEAKTNTFYTLVANKRADVAVVHGATKKYIRTHADGQMKAFYQAVRRYGIPHARRGQRVMLFRRADLEKFLASRSRGR